MGLLVHFSTSPHVKGKSQNCAGIMWFFGSFDLFCHYSTPHHALAWENTPLDFPKSAPPPPFAWLGTHQFFRILSLPKFHRVFPHLFERRLPQPQALPLHISRHSLSPCPRKVPLELGRGLSGNIPSVPRGLVGPFSFSVYVL